MIMKRIARAVFLPPLWFRWTFSIVSLSAVICIFLLNLYNVSIAYIAFFSSALGLYYLITVTIVPLVQHSKSLIMRIHFLERYYKDNNFHARIILYRGIILNILYAVFKLITGIFYHSEWLISIAVYYIILILIKYTLAHQDLRSIRKDSALDELTQWKSYRRVGWLMFLMNIGLSGITVQVVAKNQSFSYPGTIIFVMAAYSFYRMVIAVARLLKVRNDISPIFSAANVIDLSFALTSMFTLQTAMFASFARGLDTRIPNIITGTAVAVIITAFAVFMIIRGSKRLKSSRITKH